MSEPTTLTQAEFSRRRGVSKKTVTKWKEQGLLALDGDGRVKVDETEWNLDQRPATYRGGTAHRPIRTVPKDEPDPRERPQAKPSRKPPPAPEPPPRPADLDDPPPEDDPDGENLPTPLAIRRKENFLGLQRRQQYRVKEGELVERGAAEAAFFEAARDLRDGWLAWPARIAIVAAEDIRIDPATGKVDPRSLSTVLTAHVRQHLDELGEPDLDLPGP